MGAPTRPDHCVYFEVTLDLVLVLDAEGRLERTNPAWTRVLGHSPAALVGAAFADHVDPADRPLLTEALDRLGDDTRVTTVSLRHPTLDRGVRVVDWVLTEAPGGHVVGSGRDVTQLRATLARLADAELATQQALAEAQDQRGFAHAVSASMPHLLYVFDLDRRRFVYSNQKTDAYLGYGAKDVEDMGDRVLEHVIHPEDLGRVLEHQRRLAEAEDGAILEITYRARRRNGELRWYRSRETPFKRDAQTGRLVQYLGVAEDHTEARHAEQALLEANAKLKRNLETLERYNQQVEVLSELGELLQSARSDEELHDIAVGYMRRLFPGRSGFYASLAPTKDRLTVAFAWGEAEAEDWLFPEDCWAIRRGRIHSAGPELEPVYCNHHPPSAALSSACIPLQAQGEVLGVLSVWSDVPDDLDDPMALVRLSRSTAEALELALTNLRLRLRLEEQAMRDPVTGLFNRRYMEESLRREILRARRQRSDVAMLVADIDHFKRLNDEVGHDAGDEVLRHVARALSGVVREADIVCRYGGEEFALVLVDCNEDAAVRKAEELRGLVHSLRVFYHGRELDPVTVSVGVATSAMDRGWDGRSLFRAADLALYAAKRSGRNRVRVFESAMAPPRRFSSRPSPPVSGVSGGSSLEPVLHLTRSTGTLSREAPLPPPLPHVSEAGGDPGE